jgi:hypothetical protein
MIIGLNRAVLEVAGSSECVFINIGRLAIVIEKTTYKPSKWLEVWREPEKRLKDGGYDSPHYFAFGRRLFWSVEAPRTTSLGKDQDHSSGTTGTLETSRRGSVGRQKTT